MTTDTIILTLLFAYAMRGAYTAGVIKAWLALSGQPYDPARIAWAGFIWPWTVIKGIIAKKLGRG